MRALKRMTAIGIGIIMLAAAAHLNVTDHGGSYGEPRSLVIMAVMLGLIAGGVMLPDLLNARRYALACCLVATLICGEALSLLLTAERLVATRQEAQEPLKAAAEARVRAQERIVQAEKALAELPTSSARLEAAQSAQIAASNAVVAAAAEKGCRENCRLLLEQQVTAAVAEVAAARAEIDTKRKAAEQELDTARTDLANMPAQRPTGALTSVLGLPDWGLDLTAAALAAIALNLTGALLIAAGSHDHTPKTEAPMPSTAARDPRREAERYAHDRLQSDPIGRVRVRDLYAEYRGWCADRGLGPLPPEEIGTPLRDLLTSASVYRDGEDMVGIMWRGAPQVLPHIQAVARRS